MERKRKIIAALADLKQDVAGVIPVDLIGGWQKTSRDAEMQKVILKPYERSGFLVNTDSAGLSRLTSEKSLLEVMKIVSQPKEIIYAAGSKIGGKGIGVWAADNSQMFYQNISQKDLLETMAAAQRIISTGQLKVGMGIYQGTFWEIGLGMFGMDAEIAEIVAEEHTSGGEIVVNFSELMAGEKFTVRTDLYNQFGQEFFSYNYSVGQENNHFEIDVSTEDLIYPLPFDRDFYLALRKMDKSPQAKAFLESFFANKTVILIKIYHQESLLLLDQLTDWVVMNALMNEIAQKYEVEMIKSNGSLGIFICDNNAEAILFAEDVLLSLVRSGDKVSIGLARGDILLFKLEGGGKDLAGGAVNVASKIAEDIPGHNTLYVEESVEIAVLQKHKFEAFEMDKSGVMIRGNKYIDLKTS